jgi:hypothetical protein
MKLTRLLIATAVMLGLAGAVWWSNKTEKAKEGKPSADAGPKILELKDADIRQIEIAHRGGETTVLKRDSAGKWTITAPKPLAADNSAVSALTAAVSSLNADRVVDPNATDLATYGLDAPAVISAKFTMADGKAPQLLVGEDTPAGMDAYAKLEGDPRLLTIAQGIKTQLDKSSKDLRDKRLLTFDKAMVSRVELAQAGQPPIEFGRISDQIWQVLKPKPMRADGFQVDDLLSRLGEAQMDTTVSEEDAKKNAAAFASETPVATVTITQPGGTQKLEVRKAAEVFWGKSSGVEGVYKLAGDLTTLLTKKVDDFRNKKLFDFGFNDPSHFEIQDNGKIATYDKSGDLWTSNGKTMDAVSVQAVIDKLRDLSATKFVDSGFANPVMQITVVSNNGKLTEKVKIAPAGKDFIAQREGEPALYQLDASAVDDLRKTAADIKEPPPPEKQKKK